MKKIFQTVVDQGIGNCMQAAVATLFQKELVEVPNFIIMEKPMIYFFDYFEKMGYDICIIDNPDIPDNPVFSKKRKSFLEILEYDGGINGLFYATVNSKTYPIESGITHAVIIDKTGTVVHDPNPNGNCLGMSGKDILRFVSIGNFYIDFDGEFQELRTNRISRESANN